jgi:hypothetical protein
MLLTTILKQLSILVGALFFMCSTISAQDFSNDSSQKEQTQTRLTLNKNFTPDTAPKIYVHSPKIAILSSALLPGLGQIYNKKYWKVPIIWGGGIALYTYFDFNNTRYLRFKSANDEINSGTDVTDISDPDLAKYTEATILEYKNSYRRYRDRAIIFMGVLYVANIIDAMVDAHLLNYDISEDLSLEWQPILEPQIKNTYATTTYGLQVKLRF